MRSLSQRAGWPHTHNGGHRVCGGSEGGDSRSRRGSCFRFCLHAGRTNARTTLLRIRRGTVSGGMM
eukprot:3292426-Pyramimonas_sp.AAC.1